MACRLVLVNSRAGTVLDGLGRNPRETIEKAFAEAGLEADIQLVKPRHMDRWLARAARSDYDTIIVGGGDGTFSHALRHLAGTDKTLGVLPLGTMNLFGRDLGVATPFAAGVHSLATAEPKPIDLGEINGRLFHSLVGVGFFAQMARAREETRGFRLGRWVGLGVAAMRAYSRTGRTRLAIEVDDQVRDIDAYAVLVTNNLFEGASWRRTRLDAGTLEIHIGHDADILTRAKAGLDLLFGTWRDNETIETVKARRATIYSMRSRLWASVDGELVRMRTPLRFAIRPRALSVLVPQPAPEAVDAAAGPARAARPAAAEAG